MAGTFKKIAKLAGIAAAGTGIYTAGRQTGINEAGTPESTTGNQKAVTTSLERTPNIPLPGVGSSVEEANAYCRAVASAAQDSATMQKSASDLLRMRVEEPAKMPASPRALINERAQGLKVRVVSSVYAEGNLIDRFDQIVQGKNDDAPKEIDEAEVISSASESEETAVLDNGSDAAEADVEKATELHPYAKIEDAISSSDFFEGNSDQQPNAPKPFSMP